MNVANLIYYSNTKENFERFFNGKFVVKPAHMSESRNVFKKSTQKLYGNYAMNKVFDKSAGEKEPLMLDQAERGVIIEEYIRAKYELKVFVLYGNPIIASLQNGLNNVIDYIQEENKYIDLKDTYKKISNIAKELRLDFFRIDFLIKENIAYASEFAFRPSTTMPKNITELIYNKWLLNSIIHRIK